MPSTRFFSGSNRPPRLRRAFSSTPRRIRLLNSAGVQSNRERKCLALIINYLSYNNTLDLEAGFSGKSLGNQRRGPLSATNRGGAILRSEERRVGKECRSRWS